jgi:hypothetical protein
MTFLSRLIEKIKVKTALHTDMINTYDYFLLQNKENRLQDEKYYASPYFLHSI